MKKGLILSNRSGGFGIVRIEVVKIQFNIILNIKTKGRGNEIQTTTEWISRHMRA